MKKRLIDSLIKNGNRPASRGVGNVFADLKFSNPRQANQRDAMLAKQRREREIGKEKRIAQGIKDLLAKRVK